MNCVVTSREIGDLLDCLGRNSVPFKTLTPGKDGVKVLADGYPCLVGQIDKRSYIIENWGTAFSSCWGLLARTARELDALVIGAAYDPAEEHCELLAAQGPAVVRAFWSNSQRTIEPYSLGSPLVSEITIPLATPGGAGLGAALSGFGFPLWENKSRALLEGERWVSWPGDLAALLASDEMREQVNNHVRAFANPAYRPPVPKVRVRRIDPT